MPDRDQRTPIPTVDFVTLTKAVTRIETKVDSIKDDQLPPVVQASGEARDGVIKLTGWNKDLERRIKTLESRPPPEQPPCEFQQASDERIDIQSTIVSAHDKELAGLVSWRSRLVGAILAVVLSVVGGGFALYKWVGVTEAQTSNNRSDIDRHEETIKAIGDGQTKVLMSVGRIESAIEEVADHDQSPISIRVQKKIDPSNTRNELTPYQQKQLRVLLEKAGEL